VAAEPGSLRGRLLVASPSLFDPNFRRTVVLIAHHDEEGAVGIVLNRRSETPVSEAVPPLAELVEPEALVWLGGPVEPRSVLLLAELEDPEEAAALVFENVGFLRLEAELAELPSARRLRVYAGYAGWSASQLEAEIELGSWIEAPARVDDVFSDGDLFAEVLRRKGGSFRVLAQMPFDPSLN
jgi:putative transcriptional regulator